MDEREEIRVTEHARCRDADPCATCNCPLSRDISAGVFQASQAPSPPGRSACRISERTPCCSGPPRSCHRPAAQNVQRSVCLSRLVPPSKRSMPLPKHCPCDTRRLRLHKPIDGAIHARVGPLRLLSAPWGLRTIATHHCPRCAAADCNAPPTALSAPLPAASPKCRLARSSTDTDEAVGNLQRTPSALSLSPSRGPMPSRRKRTKPSRGLPTGPSLAVADAT